MGVSVTQQSLTKQFKQNNALLWDYFKSVAIEDGNKYIFSQNESSFEAKGSDYTLYFACRF